MSLASAAPAQSMRTLLRALGTKNDARYNLKIIDNGVPQERREYAPQQPAAPRDDSSSSDDFTAADEPEFETANQARKLRLRKLQQTRKLRLMIQKIRNLTIKVLTVAIGTNEPEKNFQRLDDLDV